MTENSIEQIYHNEKLLSIIVRNDIQTDGVQFLTSGELSQQLAFMHHVVGKIIQPHVHNKVSRTVNYTQEVLFIKKGKLRVDFFSEEQEYLESKILQTGDVILLICGGHGFEVLEEIEMFEVKQGPYAGDDDKTRFETKISTYLVK